MSRQQYQHFTFKPDTMILIDKMNTIVNDYVRQGYRLTVRQLYYQLVSRTIVDNTEKSYKRVTGIVNDAKLAGLMDWEAIEDRTRAFIRRTRWHSPQQILNSAANGFHMDMWNGQPERVFVIVEKEALAGVLERACQEFDVPLLAARGYPSGTVLREFALSDILPSLDDRQEITIIHLGDHDPSGIDMTRDLTERIRLFSETRKINLERIALTMRQIDEEQPPPNPAKTTDSRFADYMAKYGEESWELDALPPQYLDALVREKIGEHIDNDEWEARSEHIEGLREQLTKVADQFEGVV